MRNKRKKPVWIDPVCGMEISRTTAAEELEHEGRVYYFCAAVCKETFEEDPEKYIKSHRQHGLNEP